MFSLRCARKSREGEQAPTVTQHVVAPLLLARLERRLWLERHHLRLGIGFFLVAHVTRSNLFVFEIGRFDKRLNGDPDDVHDAGGGDANDVESRVADVLRSRTHCYSGCQTR